MEVFSLNSFGEKVLGKTNPNHCFAVDQVIDEPSEQPPAVEDVTTPITPPKTEVGPENVGSDTEMKNRLGLLC